MQFPQFALLHLVTCVELRPIKILGNCGCVAVCQFPWCAHALRVIAVKRRSVSFSETVIVPVLKSVARKRLVEAVID
jgi:hypothetical protein